MNSMVKASVRRNEAFARGKIWGSPRSNERHGNGCSGTDRRRKVTPGCRDERTAARPREADG